MYQEKEGLTTVAKVLSRQEEGASQPNVSGKTLRPISIEQRLFILELGLGVN